MNHMKLWIEPVGQDMEDDSPSWKILDEIGIVGKKVQEGLFWQVEAEVSESQLDALEPYWMDTFLWGPIGNSNHCQFTRAS